MAIAMRQRRRGRSTRRGARAGSRAGSTPRRRRPTRGCADLGDCERVRPRRLPGRSRRHGTAPARTPASLRRRAPRRSIWVETDEPCEVEVLGHTRADLLRRGPPLRAGRRRRSRARARRTEYEVALDGERRWPERGLGVPAERDPHPRRRRADARSASAPAGSRSRTTRPYTLPKDDHDDGREFDALFTLTQEMLDAGPLRRGRMLLLLLGDQVYADEVSPETLRSSRKRRDIREPPGEEVADFEEYTRLYRESWSDPAIRWLLSTVSTLDGGRRPRHPRRLEHLARPGSRRCRRSRLVGGARARRDRVLLALSVHRQPLARAAARERAARAGEGRRRRLGGPASRSPATSAASATGRGGATAATSARPG